MRFASAVLALLPLSTAVPVAVDHKGLQPQVHVRSGKGVNDTALFFSSWFNRPSPPPAPYSPPPPPGSWWDWTNPITSVQNGLSAGAVSAAAAVFDTMAPDIKVYSALPDLATLQADVTSYSKDIVESVHEETRPITSANRTTVDANFPLALQQVSTFGAWWGNTIRENYSYPMFMHEQVAYAGQPSSTLPLVEVSHVKVMTSEIEETSLRLTYATGHGSLVTDGIYHWELELSENSVYCKHIKQGKPNPNLWQLATYLLNPAALKANNDAAVISMCKDLLDVIGTGKTTRSDGSIQPGYPNAMWTAAFAVA